MARAGLARGSCPPPLRVWFRRALCAACRSRNPRTFEFIWLPLRAWGASQRQRVGTGSREGYAGAKAENEDGALVSFDKRQLKESPEGVGTGREGRRDAKKKKKKKVRGLHLVRRDLIGQYPLPRQDQAGGSSP